MCFNFIRRIKNIMDIADKVDAIGTKIDTIIAKLEASPPTVDLTPLLKAIQAVSDKLEPTTAANTDTPPVASGDNTATDLPPAQ